MKLELGQLQDQYHQLNLRCLYTEAEWLMDFIRTNFKTAQYFKAPPPISPALTCAKLYFEQKQFRKAAAALEHAKSDRLAVFLRNYSLFIALDLEGQSRKSSDTGDFVAYKPADGLDDLFKACIDATKDFPEDPYALVLVSLVQAAMGHSSEQTNQPLIAALKLDPLCWAAWRNLVVTSEPQLASIAVPTLSPFYPFFVIKSKLVLQNDASVNISRLLRKYPDDRYLRYSQAINAANLRNFELASTQFKEIYSDEPWSLDHVSIYSNALFVLGRCAELSQLTSRCCRIDRFSAETCCVLGNLWSLTGKHDQAAISFRRALRLNPRLPSAWVLVGHEYVEMRNPSGAIACYLKAARVNPADYRAWFGLGQVYDLLGSPAQAADYYRRAADLAPTDGRLWAALGAVFESEEMYEHALEAYHRATECTPVDTKLFYRIGKIYVSLEDRNLAVNSFYQFLGTQHDLDKVPLEQEDTVTALLEIAKHKMENLDSSGAAVILKSLSGLNSNAGKEALRLYSMYFGVAEF